MSSPIIPTCHHLKTNGLWCGSPALRGAAYCYFHEQWHRHRPRRRRSGQPPVLDLPLLEDANAIQIALQQVVQAIVNDELETRRAALLLYALQTASFNLKRTQFEPVKLMENARWAALREQNEREKVATGT